MPRFGQEPDLANGLFERSVLAHLARRPAEESAEDPQGSPDHALPRASDDRDESHGAAGGILHQGRSGGPAELLQDRRVMDPERVGKLRGGGGGGGAPSFVEGGG